MTVFTDFIGNIRDWTGRPDYSDALVTSFIRMAETTIKDSLRVREMIVDADAVITDRRVALPADWVEAHMITDANMRPYYFLTNDDFFSAKNNGKDKYTLRGNYIWFNAPISETEGLGVSMSYYQHIPPLTEDATWLHSKYYNIFLQSCNAAAALYSQEFERASSINGIVGGLIEAANMSYVRGKVSGSTLKIKQGRPIGR